MIRIDIPYEYNDSFICVVIERKTYMLRFTYSPDFECWVMGIYDEEKNPLSTGYKLVPDYPINHYTKNENLPRGIFTAVRYNGVGEIRTKDIEKRDVILYYLDYEELPEAARIYEQ